MKVTVRNGLCEKLFMDESGKLLATLRKTKLFGSQKAVISPDKKVKYKTNIENLPGKPAGENKRYLLKQGNRLAAFALPKYAADADHYAILQPPRPTELEVQISDGVLWRVRRSKKNAVEVYTQEGTGTLTNFFSIRPQVYVIPDKSNVFLWVGIYALIHYMMHEDDIYPV